MPCLTSSNQNICNELETHIILTLVRSLDHVTLKELALARKIWKGHNGVPCLSGSIGALRIESYVELFILKNVVFHSRVLLSNRVSDIILF